jgi:hypothetical protein
MTPTPSLRDPQGLKERQRRGNLPGTDARSGGLLRCSQGIRCAHGLGPARNDVNSWFGLLVWGGLSE